VHVELESDASFVDNQVAWSEESKLLDYHRGRGVFYPLIQLRKERQAASSSTRASAESEDGTEHVRLSGGWHFSAAVAVAASLFLFFFELSVNSSSDSLMRAIVSSAFLICAVLSADRLRVCSKDHKLSLVLEKKFASLLGVAGASAPALDRDKGRAMQTVQALSWHPYLNMFAVALKDAYKDSSSEHVAFYDMDAEQWLPTVVKHQFQRGVTCLQFQPHSGGNLAVSCDEGICLWHFEPAQLVSHASNPHAPDIALSAWMSWFAQPPTSHYSLSSSHACYAERKGKVQITTL
jgi:hypothetical protein